MASVFLETVARTPEGVAALRAAGWPAAADRDVLDRLQAGAPDLLCQAASTWTRGTFRAVEMLACAQPDVASALEALVAYQTHVTAQRPMLLLAHGSAGVTLRASGFEPSDPTAVFVLVAVEVGLRRMTGRASVASSLATTARPWSGLDVCLGIPVRVGAHALELDAEAQHAASRYRDPVVVSVLEELLSQRRGIRPRDPSVVDQLHGVLRQMLPDEPSLDQAARRMGLGPRSLQERLRLAGSSFRMVLDDVRCALACEYLERPELDLPGVAMLLGYSDASTFLRAFKRWKGVTPGDYRRALV
ncbi:MAG: helix-turn-helix transcriptional regulator [Sandaracinus sp.]|nr:helix-turn-helix transcriptional regulator [Sandaracinus sp.]